MNSRCNFAVYAGISYTTYNDLLLLMSTTVQAFTSDPSKPVLILEFVPETRNNSTYE